MIGPGFAGNGRARVLPAGTPESDEPVPNNESSARDKERDLPQDIPNYELVRLLGRGGMGAVYEARQKQIERRVAIKILHQQFADDPDVLARFMNEARIVNIIGHAGIVAVSESGQTSSGGRYLVMDYVGGITLREHLQKSGGRLAADQVNHIGRQIASTLAAAHDKKIVHRDLKPANIMLVADPESGEYRIKIVDFGIAKLGDSSLGQTQTGVQLGTPMYMSPEQCKSGRNAVDRSDVYALGIIMYEMLTGAPPFSGGYGALLTAHVAMEPTPLATVASGTPAPLVSLIHRMLAKPVIDRPTAAEVTRQLAAMHGRNVSPSQAYAVLPSGIIPAPPLGSPGGTEAAGNSSMLAQLSGAFRPRSRLVGAAALVLTLLALVGVVLLWSLVRTAARPGGPGSPLQPVRQGDDAGTAPAPSPDLVMSPDAGAAGAKPDPRSPAARLPPGSGEKLRHGKAPTHHGKAASGSDAKSSRVKSKKRGPHHPTR